MNFLWFFCFAILDQLLMLYYQQLMSHYHNNVEATKQTLTTDGYLKTGDVVTYTADGFFRVVDRFKELIKVKGYQVTIN